MFDRYFCIKVSKKSILERYFGVLFWHSFVLIFFTSTHEDNFHLYPRSRAICKQLLNRRTGKNSPRGGRVYKI